MATNWIALTGADLRKVVNAVSQEDSNENTSDDVRPGDTLDMGAANRRDQLVELAVREVRAAMQVAGRYPVAVTAGTVPPDGEWHTLVLAAWRLVVSTPGLVKVFLAGEAGQDTPLSRMHKDAVAWVEGLKKGASTVAPTDPCGQDYQTAVSAENPAVSGVKWGDSLADDDEYEAGVTDDGVVVSSLSQNMNTQ